jgi:hypothetical protein
MTGYTELQKDVEKDCEKRASNRDREGLEKEVDQVLGQYR